MEMDVHLEEASPDGYPVIIINGSEVSVQSMEAYEKLP
jgi:hypothetical protein